MRNSKTSSLLMQSVKIHIVVLRHQMGKCLAAVILKTVKHQKRLALVAMVKCTKIRSSQNLVNSRTKGPLVYRLQIWGASLQSSFKISEEV